MMKNLTKEEQSQSYFFIFILVGVATIIGLCFILITYQIDEHVEQYHVTQVQPRSANDPSKSQMDNAQGATAQDSIQEESVEELFDEGDVFEDADLLMIDDASDLDEIQVDDLTL